MDITTTCHAVCGDSHAQLHNATCTTTNRPGVLSFDGLYLLYEIAPPGHGHHLRSFWVAMFFGDDGISVSLYRYGYRVWIIRASPPLNQNSYNSDVPIGCFLSSFMSQVLILFFGVLYTTAFFVDLALNGSQRTSEAETDLARINSHHLQFSRPWCTHSHSYSSARLMMRYRRVGRTRDSVIIQPVRCLSARIGCLGRRSVLQIGVIYRCKGRHSRWDSLLRPFWAKDEQYHHCENDTRIK